MIKEAIIKIVNKGDLTYDEAYAVMNEIMSGETSPTQNAAFLAALSTKNTRAETIAEISGCAAAMREHAVRVDTGDMKTLEIVGTGGDNAHTFNISTTAAIILGRRIRCIIRTAEPSPLPKSARKASLNFMREEPTERETKNMTTTAMASPTTTAH